MRHFLKYKPPNKDHTIQIEEQHVTNQLSKFQLKLTINETGNTILPKLHR